MGDRVEEETTKNSPTPADISHTKIILDQMMNCICKLNINQLNGTGFFCKIPFYYGEMKVLMTNYHVLNDTFYKNNRTIHLLLNDGKDAKTLNLGINRETYFNKKYDIAIIEIKENDNINNCLELEIIYLRMISKLIIKIYLFILFIILIGIKPQFLMGYLLILIILKLNIYVVPNLVLLAHRL